MATLAPEDAPAYTFHSEEASGEDDDDYLSTSTDGSGSGSEDGGSWSASADTPDLATFEQAFGLPSALPSSLFGPKVAAARAAHALAAPDPLLPVPRACREYAAAVKAPARLHGAYLMMQSNKSFSKTDLDLVARAEIKAKNDAEEATLDLPEGLPQEVINAVAMTAREAERYNAKWKAVWEMVKREVLNESDAVFAELLKSLFLERRAIETAIQRLGRAYDC